MVHAAVVGMGYVGIPVALTLANSGINVIGIDIDEKKINDLNNSQYPLEGYEPGIKNLLESVVKKNLFSASLDYSDAKDADVWIVCVQTPFLVSEFKPNFNALNGAISSISKNLKTNATVIVESTIPPGTMEEVVIPLLEKYSNLSSGQDFGVGHCPERVMPGKLLHNLTNYNRVLGASDPQTHSVMLDIYSRITSGELYRTNLKTAEVIKTFENTYRDVEIAMANDFAKYCDAIGVDFYEVRDQVNTVESRNLHLPGGGVGGHCIPKDTWLLAYGSRGKYSPNFLTMAREINDSMPQHICDLSIDKLKHFGLNPKTSSITILGLSYLEESDDVRNSPSAQLYSLLKNNVNDVRIHDHYAHSYPGISHTDDIDAALKDSNLIIVMVAHNFYRGLDLIKTSKMMKTNLLIDTRNIFSKSTLKESNFNFTILGRGKSW